MFWQYESYISIFTGSKPKSKDLLNLVTPKYAAQWRVIGTLLGLERTRLDIIDHDRHHRAEDCCNAVWEEWLDMDTTASWCKVIEAIESPAAVSAALQLENSTKGSVSEPLRNAHIQLQDFYKQERYNASENDWPSYQPKRFTSVAIIHHREKHVTTREVIAIANVLYKGKVNVGCVSEEESSCGKHSSTRITTDIADIFSKLTSHTTDSEEFNTQVEPKVILIEGSPGIGKTILSKEIAFQWANSELRVLAQKFLLFLIFIHDPNLQNIQTLEHFVCYVLHCAQKNSIVTAVEQYLEETSGKHCMIVFDGYDEISEEIRCNSFISKIINRTVLKLCSLVITSRPTASAVLHGIADRRVEILGFTKEDRDRYLRESFEDNVDVIKEIKEYFKANPFIDSLCYIPLNMTILICLLKRSSGSSTILPKTQTEINNQFTIVTIARYLKRKHKRTLNVKHLQSLPMPYKEQLYNLAKLAFVFLGNDKIVFNDDDVANDCPKCAGKWDSLGLLKVVRYYDFLEDTTSSSYNFLHFSIQEFLAAYYISSLGANNKLNKQIKVLRENFWNSKYLNTGIMYAGLTGGNSSVFNYVLSESKLPYILKFGSGSIPQRVFDDKIKSLHLFQCALEAGNNELAQQAGKVLEGDIIDLSGIKMLDKVFIISFFLIRSTKKEWKMLDLSKCYMDDQALQFFTRAFSESSKGKIIIKVINMSYNHLTSSSISDIIDLIICFQTDEFILCNNHRIDYKVFDDELFSKTFTDSDNRIMKLVVVKEESFERSHYFSNYIFNIEEDLMLHMINHQFNLYFWNAGFQVCKLITCVSKIAHRDRLQFVSVYEDNLSSDEQAVTIALGLQQFYHCCYGYFEYVLQSKNNLFACNATATMIIQAIKTKHLFHRNEMNQPSNCHGVTVDLNNCLIGDICFHTIMSHCMMQSCSLWFDTLNISHNSLTVSSISTILELLKYHVIRKLIVSDNSVPNESLQSAISNEISHHCEIVNFNHNIPLILFNDIKTENNLGSEYSVTKYYVNCNVDYSLATFESTYFITYDVFLSNVLFEKDDYNQIIVLCENPFLNISIYQTNISEELLTKIEDILHSNSKSQYSYVLISENKMAAYGTNQKKINDGLINNPKLCALTVTSCTLNFSESNLLHKTLNSRSTQWSIIEFTDCNISDEDCKSLCMCLSKGEGYIKMFKLSNNCLSASSIITIMQMLEHCVVEKLVILQNLISEKDFSTSLCTQYYNGRQFLNFLRNIPLVVDLKLQDEEYNISCIYFTNSTIDCQTLQHFICHRRNSYKVFLTDNTFNKLHSAVYYSYSTLKLYFVEEDYMNSFKEIIIAFENMCCVNIIDVSKCNIDDDLCDKLCQQLFINKDIFQFIRELDISGNHLTLSCIKAIQRSLQCCVIQQIVLADNFIHDKGIIELFMGCISISDILNLKQGIPIIAINNASVGSTSYSVMMLISKFCINDVSYELFTKLQSSKTYDYHFFFTQSDVMVDDLNHSLSILYRSLPSNSSVTICETDLTDEVAEQIIKYFGKETRVSIDLIVSGKTKLLAHNSSHLLIPKIPITDIQITNCLINTTDFQAIIGQTSNLLQNIDLSECKIGDEAFKIFCKCFSLETRITTLNISMNNLTSSSIRPIVKLLCHVIVEHLIIYGNNIGDYNFNKVLLMQYWNHKDVLNFKCNTPLMVRGTLSSGNKQTVHNTYLTYLYCTLEPTGNICLQVEDSVELYNVFCIDDKGNKKTILSFTNDEDCIKVKPYTGDDKNGIIANTLSNLNIIFKKNEIELVDFSQCNINEDMCKKMCNSFFNTRGSLRHVQELDLSFNQLTSQCAAEIVECFQYCSFDFIMISGKELLEKIVDELFKAYVKKKCLVSNPAIPITLISRTETTENFEKTWEKHACTYFINYNSTDNFTNLIDDLMLGSNTKLHELVFINFLGLNHNLNLRFLLSMLLEYSFTKIMTCEEHLEDEEVLQILKDCINEHKRHAYSLSSKTMVLFYSARPSMVIDALANNIFIGTLQVTQCSLPFDTCSDMGKILRSKKHLKKISILDCNINDEMYRQFSSLLFNGMSSISYLKILDISHNCITSSSVGTIITSLQYCVIEKLIVSDGKINDGLCTSLFIIAYLTGGNILNFIRGVPLIVVTVGDEKMSSNIKCFTTFLINAKFCTDIATSVTEVVCCKDVYYKLFVANSVSENNLYYILQSFEHLILKTKNILFFGADCSDVLATKIHNLTKSSLTNVKYLILSETKLITNMSNIQPLFKMEVFYQVISENVTSRFSMVCKSLCFTENFQKFPYMKCLDLSAYQFTPEYAKLLVRSLQLCCVESIILPNDNRIAESITRHLFHDYFTGKIMQNVIAKVSLKLLLIPTNFNNKEAAVRVYFVEFLDIEELENLTLDKKCTALECYFLNSLQKLLTIPKQFLSNVLSKSCNGVFIYEDDIRDDMAMEIMRLLGEVHNCQLKYVLATKTTCFACSATMRLTAKALKHNMLITKVVLMKCKIPIRSLKSLLSIKLKHLKRITLSQCSILDDRACEYKDLHLPDSLLSKAKVISYLKLLDLSQTNIPLLEVNTIITYLQYCVIEKIVISDNHINLRIVTAMFRKMYYCGDKNVLNFNMGIPLIIVNNVQETKPIIKYTNNITTFLQNTIINEFTINQITNISDSISDYSLFIKNNCVIYNTYVSQFQQLLAKVAKFMLFGADLIDETAINIANCLANQSAKCVQYFLITDRKFLTNITTFQSMLDMIPLSGHVCALDVELFGTFCKSLLCNSIVLEELQCLDLSSFDLSLPYIQLFVELLQYCCVKQIKVSDNQIIKKITDFIIDPDFEVQKLCNFSSKIPLTFISSESSGDNNNDDNESNSQPHKCVDIIFIHFLSSDDIDKIFHSYCNSVYTKHHLIFLNCLMGNNGMYNLQHLSLNSQKYPKVTVMIHEVGLQDETVLWASKQLPTMPKSVQYILTSKSMFLAYKAMDSHIIKALNNNYSIDTFDVSECLMSDEGLRQVEYVLSRCIFLKPTLLSQCNDHISDEGYKQFSSVSFNELSKELCLINFLMTAFFIVLLLLILVLLL